MEIKTEAKNRVRWRILLEALRSAAEWRDDVDDDDWMEDATLK